MRPKICAASAGSCAVYTFFMWSNGCSQYVELIDGFTMMGYLKPIFSSARSASATPCSHSLGRTTNVLGYGMPYLSHIS